MFQVFAGDPRTEMMLAQLLAFFGPEAKKGLVMDGTLTCRQCAPRPVGVPRSQETAPSLRATIGPYAESYRRVLGGRCFL